jgi:putative phosphoribosyl transferase
MFKDRLEAGQLLAKELFSYRNNENVVIAAIPRGGLPIGFILAKELNLPLEIVLSKKIGHPTNKEFAIGAVTINSRILSSYANEIPNTYIENETKNIRKILAQRYIRYYGNRMPVSFENKIVILVDDGVATGNTLISSIELIQQQKPSQIVIALPVAPLTTFKKLEQLTSIDKIICLLTPVDFRAVGQFYSAFNQVSDEEVIVYLKSANENYSS